MGIWQVKPGSEDDFVTAWQEMADWTMREVQGDQPSRFVSFGPWPDERTIAAWRGSAGFQERVGRIRGLLEDFSPATLDPVAVQG